MPPQSPSPRRSHRRSPHAHATAQEEDSDADTEGSGSGDGLDVPQRMRDEDYCPSPSKLQGHDSGDDSDDENSTVASVAEYLDLPTPRFAIPPPAPRALAKDDRQDVPRSHREGVERQYATLRVQYYHRQDQSPPRLARFLLDLENGLRDVSLKRITEGDKTTFQLQFAWTPDRRQPHADRPVSHPKKGRALPKASLSATRSSGDKWTSEEEDTVRKMRQGGYSWEEI